MYHLVKIIEYLAIIRPYMTDMTILYMNLLKRCKNWLLTRVNSCVILSLQMRVNSHEQAILESKTVVYKLSDFSEKCKQWSVPHFKFSWQGFFIIPHLWTLYNMHKARKKENDHCNMKTLHSQTWQSLAVILENIIRRKKAKLEKVFVFLSSKFASKYRVTCVQTMRNIRSV